MRFSRTAAARILLAIGLIWLSSVAEAQIRYVASTGRDTNPCTRAAPCLTLQRGIDATAASGELRVLDSGSYGAATIAKSLTVASDGHTIFGQITIDAAGATVVLRGFTLNGTGRIMAEGIHIKSAAVVHIENCEIERFEDHGIYFAAEGAKLFVTGTVSRDNTGAGLVSYDSAFTSSIGSMRVEIDNSRFENNGYDGIRLSSTAGASISRTVASGNFAQGIEVAFGLVAITATIASENQGAGYFFVDAEASLDSSLARGSSVGLVVFFPDTRVTLSNSTITANETGILVSNPGTARTRGNNTIVGNSTAVVGTLTPLAGQ